MESQIRAPTTQVQDTRLADALIEAIAEADGCHPVDLTPPLYSAVDLDALEALFEGEDASDVTVTFTYREYSVCVEGGDRITVTDRSDSDPAVSG